MLHRLSNSFHMAAESYPLTPSSNEHSRLKSVLINRKRQPIPVAHEQLDLAALADVRRIMHGEQVTQGNSGLARPEWVDLCDALQIPEQARDGPEVG